LTTVKFSQMGTHGLHFIEQEGGQPLVMKRTNSALSALNNQKSQQVMSFNQRIPKYESTPLSPLHHELNDREFDLPKVVRTEGDEIVRPMSRAQEREKKKHVY
jgi:hypothetical protein